MTGDLGHSASPVGRRLPVRYRFSGALHELEQTFVPAPGEQRITTGQIAVRGRGGMLPHAGIALLTDQRLCVLVHYVFRPDQGIELPRASVVSVRQVGLPTLRYLRLTYRTHAGQAHLDLAAGNVRPTLLGVEPIQAHRLVDAMRDAWGQDAPMPDAP
jgi:hypothetical protein